MDSFLLFQWVPFRLMLVIFRHDSVRPADHLWSAKGQKIRSRLRQSLKSPEHGHLKRFPKKTVMDTEILLASLASHITSHVFKSRKKLQKEMINSKLKR